MEQGETKVFSTFSDNPSVVQSQWITPNTIKYTPVVTYVSRYGHYETAGDLDPECTMMCGMLIFVPDGRLVYAHNLGSGSTAVIRVTGFGKTADIPVSVEYRGGWIDERLRVA